MEHLWAPWRNTYVTHGVSDADLFSRLAASTEDEAHHILLRSKASYAVLNAFPYNAGHLMVVPYRVVTDLDELSPDELLDLFAVLQKAKVAVTRAYRPHGFNVGINLGAAAGAGVPKHLHIHLVPRWSHDANFMTTAGGTRVHPSDLATVYRDLRAALAAPEASASS
jgi:ATP adenylyltransferase